MSHAEAVGPAKDDRAGAKSARLLLLVLVSAVFIVVANGAMVNVAVPSIQREYSASEGQVGWVMTGYLLVFAVGIPFQHDRARDGEFGSVDDLRRSRNRVVQR